MLDKFSIQFFVINRDKIIYRGLITGFAFDLDFCYYQKYHKKPAEVGNIKDGKAY